MVEKINLFEKTFLQELIDNGTLCDCRYCDYIKNNGTSYNCKNEYCEKAFSEFVDTLL